EALHRSESNLAALIDNTSDPIWSVDRDLRLLIVNNAAREGFAKVYGKEELPLGGRPTDLLPAAEREYWHSLYRRALAGGQFSAVYEYVASGQQGYTELWFNPITGAGGITGVAVF